jgi:hypothetical protein
MSEFGPGFLHIVYPATTATTQTIKDRMAANANCPPRTMVLKSASPAVFRVYLYQYHGGHFSDWRALRAQRRFSGLAGRAARRSARSGHWGSAAKRTIAGNWGTSSKQVEATLTYISYAQSASVQNSCHSIQAFYNLRLSALYQ